MGTYLVYRACVRVFITIAKLHTNTCVCYYTLFVRWLRFVPGFLFLSILCQILVSVTRIYKVILLTDVLDLSDLRPVLIECTIVCAMLLVLLDSYTIYVEVSLCQFIGFSPFFVFHPLASCLRVLWIYWKPLIRQLITIYIVLSYYSQLGPVRFFYVFISLTVSLSMPWWWAILFFLWRIFPFRVHQEMPNKRYRSKNPLLLVLFKRYG